MTEPGIVVGSPEWDEKVDELSEAVLAIRRETEKRYNAGKPPKLRPSQVRHRRENAAAKRKKRLRKQSRIR
jgi:hypothetical protein